MTISKLLPNWWKCETMSPPFSIKGKYNTSNGDYSAKSWSIFKKSPISGILIHWTTRSLYWKLNLVKVEGRYEGFYESYESAELFQPWLYLLRKKCWQIKFKLIKKVFVNLLERTIRLVMFPRSPRTVSKLNPIPQIIHLHMIVIKVENWHQ